MNRETRRERDERLEDEDFELDRKERRPFGEGTATMTEIEKDVPAPGTKYKIEKGIPIPRDPFYREYAAKYPWRQMEVGDSFAIPIEEKERIRYAIVQARKRNPEYKFVTRTLPFEGLIRIWRVAVR